MSPEQSPDIHIHETAVVDPAAKIGSGTSVWHFCHVRAGTTIGTDCSLGHCVFVDQGSTIGDRVRIQNHVSVFSGVTIGDDVLVGPAVTFTNDRYPRVGGEWTPVRTVIGNGVGLGANSTIVCGATIGAWAMVGAGSVVVGDIPAHALVVGNPARVIGWVNREGNVISRSPRCPEELLTSP